MTPQFDEDEPLPLTPQQRAVETLLIALLTLLTPLLLRV
jgi:hypothetical protein